MTTSQRYIDEQSYRWNTRDWLSSARFEDMFMRAAKSFDYADVLSLSSVIDLVEWKRKRKAYMDWYLADRTA